MRFALFEPDIAGNVGTILRLGACLDIGVDLIEPMGFAYSDRSLARAGMDYAAHASVRRHVDWAAFDAQVTGRIVLLSTRGTTRIDAVRFDPGDVLLLGAESSGVPAMVHDRADVTLNIPLVPGRRSLNVAVAAAMAAAEALRQIDGWPTEQN
ncbi:MAG: rRNA methyltransferase [Sphingomonas sp. 28-66-16]|nr:MAG: rRNA methyltransferase [Sphingomonas sp. 28-66-16]